MRKPKSKTADEPLPPYLLDLLTLVGPTGDESPVADWLAAHIADQIPAATVTRLGDNLIARRGLPRTAVFAHTDTVGFTMGYDRALIPIGSPHFKDGDRLRAAVGWTGRLHVADGKPTLRHVRDPERQKEEPIPGSRWVYARRPTIKGDVLTTPYLDDRAGVWAALDVLRRSENVAVAFCTGEEQHGHGARVCGDYLFRELGVAQALIADITWHTKDTPNGKGVVVSLRDAFCPRQRFLDRVLALAGGSGIPHQRELQSAGSSDGGHLLRSTVPIDWVFIGAPSKRPHTAREQLALPDLHAMSDLMAYLAEHL